MNDYDVSEDFSGVFYFTNPTNKERKYLWNNKEYVFPPESTVPLIIPTETLENIQEIRKRFALRMAEERFYEGEEYQRLVALGNKSGGIPPTFDPKVLEPMIEECLKPLPIKRAKVQKGKDVDDESNYKITKAMGEGDNPVELFKEENRPENIKKFGKQ